MPVTKGTYACCILLAGLITVFLHGCREPEVFLHTSFSPPPSAQNCAACHAAIFTDWLRSAHRDAWSDDPDVG